LIARTIKFFANNSRDYLISKNEDLSFLAALDAEKFDRKVEN